MRGRGKSRFANTTVSRSRFTIPPGPGALWDPRSAALAHDRIEHVRGLDVQAAHGRFGGLARAVPPREHEERVEPHIDAAADAALEVVVDDEDSQRVAPHGLPDAAHGELEDGPVRLAQPPH